MQEPIQAGVWIDHKQAIIIHRKNNEEKKEKILSGLESRIRVPGEGKQYTRMGAHYFTFEKKNEEKRSHHLKKYYREIIKKINDADAILIMGPAEAKNEFCRELTRFPGFLSKTIRIKTEARCTENQVAAKVRKFFHPGSKK
jgi:hypothetical protein